MNPFISLKGVITSIESITTGLTGESGCTLLMGLQTSDQGYVTIVVDTKTYVLSNHTFFTGETAIVFYDSYAPVPLIYPPRYRAIVMIHSEDDTTQYTLDYFNYNLTNSSNTLKLNPLPSTPSFLSNGQHFTGTLNGRLLLVAYQFTTRSIPAQATPLYLIVFCHTLG